MPYLSKQHSPNKIVTGKYIVKLAKEAQGLWKNRKKQNALLKRA